jgi:hypothetical protein
MLPCARRVSDLVSTTRFEVRPCPRHQQHPDGIADKNRQFVYGTSYGGYMTTWLVGQTNRFKVTTPTLILHATWRGSRNTKSELDAR